MCILWVYIYLYILPFFFQQDVRKENESFKAQIQELKQENCKQVQLPVAVLLREVKSGWWWLACMAWKTRSCTAHGNPGAPVGLGCTEAAFLAVAYLFLISFIIWTCSLVLHLMPAVFLARGGCTGSPQRPKVQLSGV